MSCQTSPLMIAAGCSRRCVTSAPVVPGAMWFAASAMKNTATFTSTSWRTTPPKGGKVIVTGSLRAMASSISPQRGGAERSGEREGERGDAGGREGMHQAAAGGRADRCCSSLHRVGMSEVVMRVDIGRGEDRAGCGSDARAAGRDLCGYGLVEVRVDDGERKQLRVRSGDGCRSG